MQQLHKMVAVLIFLGLGLLMLPWRVAAQEFPDGITPGDAYARATQLGQFVDVLLQVKGVEAPPIPQIPETSLGLLHVYQMALAIADRIQELDEQVGIQQLPTLASSPRLLAPRDVKFVEELMLDNLRRAAQILGAEDRLPTETPTAAEKTPTDVFTAMVEVFVKLDRLCGHDQISPNVVYEPMVRATADVRSMLQQGDPASWYRIDAPPSESDRSPRHVLERALEIRSTINQLLERLELQAAPIPSSIPEGEIDPIYPFIQTQIIIAELNLLKVHLKTFSSTPLPIPVTRKTSTHAHQQALLLHHLLQQVPQILARSFTKGEQ